MQFSIVSIVTGSISGRMGSSPIIDRLLGSYEKSGYILLCVNAPCNRLDINVVAVECL